MPWLPSTNVFKRNDLSLLHHHHFHQIHQPITTPNIGFSKALSGFLMMMTQNGKLLYISDNAAEYLGHSMEDLLIHGDSVYDMIDKQDHQAIQTELVRSQSNNSENDFRIFLCRMNVSRNARRQMRFGDQKGEVQSLYLECEDSSEKINDPEELKKAYVKGVMMHVKGMMMNVKGVMMNVKGVMMNVKGVMMNVKGVMMNVKGVMMKVKGVMMNVKGVMMNVKEVMMNVKGVMMREKEK
ncbi:hypothetical protein M8J76_000899 [Diaphorina citri]|nr:hypothetical protein M8J76_000899 [Diaphorina citri]